MKVCVLTAARSEYGLLRPIIKKMLCDSYFDVRVVVTGMHLSEEFGYTYKEIEEDNIPIDAKIDMPLDSDIPSELSKSMATELTGIADYFHKRRPDYLLLLGDRYEMLPAAIAALNERIPIIHLSGGDVTEGAIDDVVRHCLTKMSYLHFPATEEHRQRIIQMGEDPKRVFAVGAMSVESAVSVPLMNRQELIESLNWDWNDSRLAVVTYHPVTTEGLENAGVQCKNLLAAIDKIEDLKVIFTKANADSGGRIINNMLDEYVLKHSEKACVFTSLGQRRYISAVALADVVIGNSSSGLSEVPSFGVPTVNIGNRQKGRMHGKSVIDCGNSIEEIVDAISKAFSEEFKKEIENEVNPYGDGKTSDKIIKIVKESGIENINISKEFYDFKQ